MSEEDRRGPFSDEEIEGADKKKVASLFKSPRAAGGTMTRDDASSAKFGGVN
jgi:hypothetical protein